MIDLEDHLHVFQEGMEDRSNPQDIWCKMFQQTLFGNVVGWYWALVTSSIHTFEELKKVFRVAFNYKHHERNMCGTLLNVFQGEKETLQKFIDRFTVMVLAVGDIQDLTIMMALCNSLKGANMRPPN